MILPVCSSSLPRSLTLLRICTIPSRKKKTEQFFAAQLFSAAALCGSDKEKPTGIPSAFFFMTERAASFCTPPALRRLPRLFCRVFAEQACRHKAGTAVFVKTGLPQMRLFCVRPRKPRDHTGVFQIALTGDRVLFFPNEKRTFDQRVHCFVCHAAVFAAPAACRRRRLLLSCAFCVRAKYDRSYNRRGILTLQTGSRAPKPILQYSEKYFSPKKPIFQKIFGILV